MVEASDKSTPTLKQVREKGSSYPTEFMKNDLDKMTPGYVF